MYSPEAQQDLTQFFTQEEREQIQRYANTYNSLLAQLPPARTPGKQHRSMGILALNGASGAGQSYVMARVKTLLDAHGITLPRIFLLATREPRPDEGYKNPYIFVIPVAEGFQDRFHPERIYTEDDIYYYYSSRPGAANAILMEDARRALQEVMYLETVIPTLLHIQKTAIKGIPAWEDNLAIVYLAVPTGEEWIYRLLNREPERLTEPAFRVKLLGRIRSSLEDMSLAAEHKTPTVLNRYGEAEKAAAEILQAWGLVLSSSE